MPKDEIVKEELKEKVIDIKGEIIEEAVIVPPTVLEQEIEKEMAEKEQELKEEMVELPLNSVNHFMSIVDAVMIDDVRGEVILKHFTKMLVKSNPQLSIQKPQQPQQ